MSVLVERFPLAVHVAPLHALAGIAKAGALRSKEQLARLRGTRADTRQTTADVDGALGLAGFVHLYLLPAGGSWPDVPILNAQLQAARQRPFPHAAIVFETRSLLHPEARLCLWNVAVSRPKVEGVAKGGNWTRGTKAASIVRHWATFKETRPEMNRARGEWVSPIAIPTLSVDQAERRPSLVRKAAGGMPELLLKSHLPLVGARRVVVFSDEDLRAVRQFEHKLPQVRFEAFPGYESDHPETVAIRSAIRDYFNGGPYPLLDFDTVRTRPKRTGHRSS